MIANGHQNIQIGCRCTDQEGEQSAICRLEMSQSLAHAVAAPRGDSVLEAAFLTGLSCLMLAVHGRLHVS